ncbi:TRAP transporter permease [Proteiniclasticum sp. SCR006]|uniref:TRAP transporter permease n=1 Tax=Proteiniclasticum aestuarii TaxID=2817862 RepID=A0A939H7U5_9CLOT|nr:TRAP transporter permease [Proteiniclasticum aestuarii]MBO1265824.1 TRAP transporter permease [Proteiniclasticum aestuarii]
MENAQNSSKNGIRKVTDRIVIILSIILAFFHLYTASIGVLPAYEQAAIHWGIVGSYIVLTRPLKFKGGKIIDLLILFTNIFVSWYQISLQEKFIETAGVYSRFDIIISVVAILLALEIARRAIGNILPIISVLFLIYALFGNNLPGVFKTVKFSVSRLAPYLFTSSDGLYGQTLYVSAQFIFLFVLFGTILDMTGAGEFFVNIAFALTGKVKGGPAQAAIYSSMLMGSINGSGAANVVTTGTFTIPLMKKVGFKPAFSGAVEAVASNGGQIMPPVMGAVAFLMAEITGIEYSKIALAAIPTAILYYITLSVSVYLEANKQDIPVTPKDQQMNAGKVFKEGWVYLLPLIVLMGMLIYGYSAQRAAFITIILSVIIGFLKNRSAMNMEGFLKAFKSAISGIGPIAAACILAGIVMGILNMTGLGLKISSIIIEVSGGSLIIALLLAMITSLVLGMGLPTSAAYMVLAILVAPALIKLGVTVIGAHMFILYFGALSTITPPVALSTFAAAGIAGSNMWETGFAAMKLAAAGFIIPFIFAFSPELLLIGTFGNIVFSLMTAVLGSIVLSISLSGWMKVELSAVSRIVLFLAGIMLIMPDPLIGNILGFVVALVTIMIQYKVKTVRSVKIA